MLFQTRYAVFTDAEQVLLPLALLTVSIKFVLVLAVRAAVVHEPPDEPEKVVQVPLAGEKEPFAGPLVMLQVSVEVCPFRISVGLAERLHVGIPPPPLDDDEELLVLPVLLLVLLPGGFTVMEKFFCVVPQVSASCTTKL